MVGNNFLLVKSIFVCLVGQGMGSDREFVLFLARDTEFRRKLVRADPHHLSGRVVRYCGSFQAQVFSFETLQHVFQSSEWSPLFHGLGQGDEFLSDRSCQTNGNIGKSFNATCDNHICVACLDRRCARGDSGIGRNTGLCYCVAGYVVGQTGIDGCLSGNIGSFDFLNDIPAHHVVDNVLGQGGLVDQALYGKALEINGHFVLVYR
mmetsp:Transcript_6121/g.13228  ORF Transcript_6121/g.13228 Transcript_6121/m.13228 type:complete len:206 (+) Transcript_6121:2946-3563(+)